MTALRARMVVILLAAGSAGSLAAADEKPAAKPAEKPVTKPAEKAAVKRADKPGVPPTADAAPAKPVPRARPARNVAAELAKREPDHEDAMALQYVQYMHPRMWRELDFIRQTCDLTVEQRPLIKAAGMASAKEAAKLYVHNQQQRSTKDTGVFIRKEIFKTLETILTPDQMAKYEQESARRAASIKNVIILSTVANLDGLLYFSSEQRDKISESLTTNWQEDWEVWQGISRYGGRYYPMIPDQQLVPHLDEKQKKVWQGARKINPSFLSGGNARPQADEDWWSGKDEREGKKAEARGESPEPAKAETNKKP